MESGIYPRLKFMYFETAKNIPIEVPDPKNYAYLFKTILLGDKGTGKTELIYALTGKKTFSSDPHDELDFAVGCWKHNDAVFKMQIWDYTNNAVSKYPNMQRIMMRGTSIVLLVFNVTQRKSFDNIRVHFDEMNYHGGQSIRAILVANFIDAPEDQHQVSRQEGEAKAKELNIPFVTVSAKTRMNLVFLVQAILEEASKAAKAAEEDMRKNPPKAD